MLVRFKLMLVLQVLVISGCMSGNHTNRTMKHGYSPETIRRTAAEHDESVSTISKEAKSILKVSDNAKVKTSAVTILAEDSKLAHSSKVLATAAGDIEKSDREITQLNEEIESLNTSEQKWFRRMAIFAKFIGFLAIPAGIVLAWKISAEFIALSAFGILLIVTSSILKILERFGIWLGAVTIIVIGFVAIRMYLLQRSALTNAIHVGETLKQEMKEVAPDKLAEIFGSGVKPGIIVQPPVVEKQIRAIRKHIGNVSAPVVRMPQQ